MFWLDSCHLRKDFELILLLSLMTPLPLSFQELDARISILGPAHIFISDNLGYTFTSVHYQHNVLLCNKSPFANGNKKKVIFKVIGLKYPQPSNLTFLLYHSNALSYSLVSFLYPPLTCNKASLCSGRR